ncbi:serine carboxypeptidase S28-domain-containing protein [Jimgerdemannia flammicorona]|uniref:Serine carboxypeptidase S28-domain-containing protein n=1 Tax=Jimgerdemannia flammicorona TaxID=994334 RepID=A0A433DKD8_9FUNG|nr:serine carboxypeptidase S28-domain-containing protein [Jimgerdemannia flammicorona]
MARLIFLWAFALALVSIVNAITLTRLLKIQSDSKNKLFAPKKIAVSSALGPFTFPQKVDHFDGNNATFSQRYWVNTTNYRPGGPIIFFNVGEEDASNFQGYLIKGETSLLAQKLGGVVIVYEHLYYGESNPVPQLVVPSGPGKATIPAIPTPLKNFAKSSTMPQHRALKLQPTHLGIPRTPPPPARVIKLKKIASAPTTRTIHTTQKLLSTTLTDRILGNYASSLDTGQPLRPRAIRRSFPDSSQRNIGKGSANYSILPKKPRTNYINKKFGGWKLEADYIFWINGEFDPWRSLSVASPNAPKRLSTEKSPNVVIKGAVHGWDDVWSPTTVIPEPIVEVHNQLIASLSGWLKSFNATK